MQEDVKSKSKGETSLSYLSNAFYNYLAIVLLSVISFVFTPILIKSLGKDSYALFRIALSTIVGYLAMLNMGIGVPVKRELGKALYNKDDVYASKVVSSGFSLYLILGLIAFFATIIIAIYIRNFMSVPDDLLIPFRLLIIVTGIFVLLNFVVTLLSSVFVVKSRYDYLMLTTVASRFLLYLFIPLLAIFFTKPLYAASLSTILSQIIVFSLMLYLVNKTWKEIRIGISYIDFKLAVSMVSLGFFGMIILVGPLVVNQTQLIIVSNEMSLEDVAGFSIALFVFTQMTAIVTSLVSPVIPLVLRLKAKNDSIAIAKLFTGTIYRGMYLLLFFILPLYFFGDYFMRGWVGEEFVYIWPIMNIMLFGALMLPMVMTVNYIMNVTGRIKSLAMYSIIMVIVYIVYILYFKFYSTLTLSVFAMALSMSYIIRSLLSFRSAICQIGGISFVFQLFRYAICPIPVFLAAWGISKTIRNILPSGGLFEFIIISIIMAIPTAVIGYYIVIEKSDRESIKNTMKSVFFKFQNILH